MKTLILSFSVALIVSLTSTLLLSYRADPLETGLETASLTTRIQNLEEDLADAREQGVSQDQLQKAFADFREAAARTTTVAELKADIARLEETLLSLNIKPLTPEDIAAAENRVREMVEENARAAQKKNRQDETAKRTESTRRWATRTARKQAASLTKALTLDANQSRQISDFLTEAAEASAPHYPVIKDSSASRDDRLNALTEIQNVRARLEQQATAVLNYDQATQMREIHRQDGAWVGRMIQQLQEGQSSGSSK